MNSKAIREKIDSIEARIKQGPSAAMAEWFDIARQAGHTEACIRVAKQMGAIVLAWDRRHAEQIRDRCGLNSGVVVESIYAAPKPGSRSSVVVDHYAVTEALSYYDARLRDLTSATRDYISTLETENAAMRERLSIIGADLEAYRGRYASLKSEMNALAESTKAMKEGAKS